MTDSAYLLFLIQMSEQKNLIISCGGEAHSHFSSNNVVITPVSPTHSYVNMSVIIPDNVCR